MNRRGVMLHLSDDMMAGRIEIPRFYAKLIDGFGTHGLAVEVVTHRKSRAAAMVAADARFHIFDHGRVRHARALNAGVAYIYPFWNLDPWGIRAFSSIGAAEFAQGDVDGEAASQMMRRLRRRLVAGRRSRYPQAAGRADDLPAGAVAVFLQSEAHRDVAETCYLGREAMLDAALAGAKAAGRAVICKPHPRDQSDATRSWLADLAARHPHLHISDANIHDILANAAVVVTINSAVGIEGYLHRVPLILCGQADFHHIATTAKTPTELLSALKAALGGAARPRAYAKYLYWYFGINCLSAQSPDLVEAVLGRIRAAGYAL